MTHRLFILTAVLILIFGCSDSDSTDPSATLYGTWVTDLDPLNHEGHSHSTFNSDGTYELDMEFFVEGGDCFLDVTTTGTFVANATTLTITHEDGTRSVSLCSEETYNHDERPMAQEELDSHNEIGQMMWSVEGDVLTLSDGADIIRTYTRLVDDPAAALYGSWATDLDPLNHEGYSHSTFNSDGTYELDMEFFVEGGDCFLDVTTTGTFVANATTLTITHEDGTRSVSLCSEETYNHDERPMAQEELDSHNEIGRLIWSVDGDVLTLIDGADIIRTYTRLYDR